MGQLAETIAEFLTVAAAAAAEAHRDLVADDIRYPRGGPSIFQGSDVGREAWSSAAGQSLLSLVAADPQSTDAAGPFHDRVDQTLRTIASVVSAWKRSGTAPEAFAANTEELLWTSFRRKDIISVTLAIVAGVRSPVQSIFLPSGWSIYPRGSPEIEAILTSLWTGYETILPNNDFAYFTSSVTGPRVNFGGMAPLMGRVRNSILCDIVWLATGTLPRTLHSIDFETDPFPMVEPRRDELMPPPGITPEPAELDQHVDEILALAARLDWIHSQHDGQPDLDLATRTTLDTIRDYASTLQNTASSVLSLLIPFAAAEGSLTVDYQDSDVIGRYARLCGKDDSESRRLRDLMEKLDPLRDAAAHGRPPTNATVHRLLDDYVPADSADPSEAWHPGILDPSPRLVRLVALDLMRGLYRSWLLATLRSDHGEIVPGLSRTDLIARLRESRKSASALHDLRTRIGTDSAQELAALRIRSAVQSRRIDHPI
jgi:hypothetical protein